MTRPFLRPEILGIPIEPHGGIDREEIIALGSGPDFVLDLSVNTSGIGPSEAIKDAIFRVADHEGYLKYPDPRAKSLREALAESFGLTSTQVITGNGSTELIWLAPLATLRPGDPAVILGPAFGEYRRSIRIAGGEPVEVNAEPTRFTPPVERFVSAILDTGARLAFLTNPNNPTGQMIPAATIEQILARCPNTLFVVDEAYLPFAREGIHPGHLTRLLPAGNLVLLRSMTKDRAIPGIRLGFALGDPAVIQAFDSVAPPWSVNSFAIAAGHAAIEDLLGAEQVRLYAADLVNYLAKGLRTLGYDPVPTTTNFLIVDVGDGARFREDLIRWSGLVRDCASFGLPEYVRISPRAPSSTDALIETLIRIRYPDREFRPITDPSHPRNVN